MRRRHTHQFLAVALLAGSLALGVRKPPTAEADPVIHGNAARTPDVEKAPTRGCCRRWTSITTCETRTEIDQLLDWPWKMLAAFCMVNPCSRSTGDLVERDFFVPKQRGQCPGQQISAAHGTSGVR